MNIVVKFIWQIFTMVEILETQMSFQDTKIVFAIRVGEGIFYIILTNFLLNFKTFFLTSEIVVGVRVLKEMCKLKSLT